MGQPGVSYLRAVSMSAMPHSLALSSRRRIGAPPPPPLPARAGPKAHVHVCSFTRINEHLIGVHRANVAFTCLG